jgi:NADPH2:quinone reductase
MKAVGFRQSLPIDNPAALLDLELPDPEAAGGDLLVEVRAVAVNPVDTKVRRRGDARAGSARVLGWDAAGVVRSAGSDCRLFQAGDEVFYAGALQRQGCNAELQLVDERLVGRKPTTLSFAEAAALPLTSITAWELLFDRLGVVRGDGGSGATLLVVGGAGGVGSMLIQLARRLTALRVVATASRPASADWCSRLGAHAVIDHRQPLAAELERAGIEAVQYVAGLTQTDQHFPAYAEIIAPQGRLVLIDDPQQAPDVRLLKGKSISLHWESMFTRSLFHTPDMIAQHQLLMAVADLMDAGRLRTTLSKVLGPIDAEHLREAHAALESGTTIGKLVLEGF